MSRVGVAAWLKQMLPFSQTREIAGQVPREFETTWQHPEFPTRQRVLVNEELARLRRGDVDRVFAIAARLVGAVAAEGASILDAACASGFYSEVLATCVKAQLNYTGIDLSPSMIDLARENYPHLNFQVASLTALPFPDRAFDIAFSSGAIVHVPDYRQAIREVARVARAHVVSHRMWVYPDGTPTRKFVERLYDIPVLKIFMSEPELLELFGTLHLDVVQSDVCLDAQPDARGPYAGVVIKSYLLRKMNSRPA